MSSVRLLLAAMRLSLGFLRLEFPQIVGEAVETLLPVAAGVLQPVDRLLHRRGLEPAGGPPGGPAPPHEPPVLPHAGEPWKPGPTPFVRAWPGGERGLGRGA